jgi:hypothetical protein
VSRQTGNWAEAVLAAHLAKQGLHVALALGSHCPFDVVAVDGKGRVSLYDAKARKLSIRAPRQKRATLNKQKPTREQARMGVKVALVLPDGSVFMSEDQRRSGRNSRRRRSGGRPQGGTRGR